MLLYATLCYSMLLYATLCYSMLLYATRTIHTRLSLALDLGQGLGIKDYAHCSSPIRRYSDLHNQHMLFDSYAGGRGGVDGGDALKVLNKHVAETSNP